MNLSKKKVIRTAAVPGSLYHLLKGQLQFLNEHYDVVGVASKGQLLEKTAKKEGIRVHGINIERNISPFKDLVSLVKLFLLFRKERPFLVHSITPKAGLLTMAAGFLAQVPFRAHTFTGLIFPTQKGFKKKMLLFFDKCICFFATNIYPEGQGVKSDLISYKVTGKPLHIMANGNVNGIDLTHFDPSVLKQETTRNKREKWNIDKDSFVFIYVGRLVNDKGINELARAFKRLSQEHKKITLIMIGSSKGESDVLPESTLNLMASMLNIICVGNQEDIRPFLAMGNAFVFPSYREGFPNVVLEAGAMGLPAIVTDINGSNEIIIEGKNGVVIPPKNEKALYSAMNLFVRDPKFVAELKENARRLIVSRYNREAVWKALLKEYQKMENTFS